MNTRTLQIIVIAQLAAMPALRVLAQQPAAPVAPEATATPPAATAPVAPETTATPPAATAPATAVATTAIDLRQLTPATVGKPAKGSYLPVAFAVSVQGDLNHILTFLQQVENGAHYSRVVNATLSGNSVARNSPLTLALSLELLGTP